jgi:shikimate kinase
MADSEPKYPSDSVDLKKFLGSRSLVLVGMMGVGKSSVGRRLAQTLDLPFVDADKEIEEAANRSIVEIFETYGEAHFRDGEKRVIQRLLTEGPQVLATGGGAFMNEETRAEIADKGISIWLNAELSVLIGRVKRKPTRPLLQQANPEQVLADLLELRNPVYALSDINITSRDVPHEAVVQDILTGLTEYIANHDGHDDQSGEHET